MSTLGSGFAKLDRAWFALVTLVAFIATTVALLGQVEVFESLSGGKPLLEVPDLLGSDLYAAAAAYPAAAHAHYRTVIQPLDMLYPATAGLFFTVLLVMSTQRLFEPSSWGRQLPWLGVAVSMTDWAENIGVFWILRGASANAWVEDLTHGFTAIKFATSGITAMAAVVLGLWVVGRALLRRAGEKVLR